MAHRPRILLMPSPVSSGSVGTTTKNLGLARLLQRRGSEIRFLLGGKLADFVRQQGFVVEPSPVPQHAHVTQPIRTIIDFMQWAGLLNVDFIEQAINAEIAAIRHFRPDVIFAEARPSAAISAAAMGVPLVTIASWPTHPGFERNQVEHSASLAVFNRHAHRFGLEEINHVAELLFLRSTIKISPSLPELEPELQTVPDIHFVGYMLDLERNPQQLPKWYHAWRTRPLLLVYFSVSAISPQLYIKILPEAFSDQPFNVLCACGFHYALRDGDLEQSTISNTRFVDFIPLQSVIADTALILFHGGQDTMLTALLHGLPSITIPGQHFERQYNSTQLERLGVSRMLPVHAFRARRLRQVANEVLMGPYTTNSIALARRLRAFGGTEQASDIILSVV